MKNKPIKKSRIKQLKEKKLKDNKDKKINKKLIHKQNKKQGKAAKKLARADNLYVDSSSSIMTIEKDEVLPGTQYLTPRKAREYVETFGTDRVLFGTDYPMWSPKAEVDTFLSLGFTAEEYKKMFSENAKKAFRLN